MGAHANFYILLAASSYTRGLTLGSRICINCITISAYNICLFNDHLVVIMEPYIKQNSNANLLKILIKYINTIWKKIHI